MKGLLAAFALVGLLVIPGVAAHAEPWQSSPGSGERLAESPSQVQVAFTESVYEEGSWIEVWDLSGNRLDFDDLRIEGDQRPVMTISVPPLDDGPYLIKWQTYSKTDGHTIRGAIGFAVGGFAPPSSQDGSDEVYVGPSLARGTAYFGYVLAVGAIVFAYAVIRTPGGSERPRILNLTMMAGAIAHLVGIVWLLLDTAAATGIGFTNYLASSGGRDMWMRAVVAAGLAILSGLWLYGPVRPRTSLPILSGLWLLAVALGARFGHGATATAWFVQTLHAVSIAAWLGGLLMLFAFLLPMKKDDEGAAQAQALGIRFSTMAVIAVTLVAVTGLGLSLIVIGRALFIPTTWFANPWRAFLSIKIGLVLLMIVLATINREILLARDRDVGPIRTRIRNFLNNMFRWQAIRQSGGVSDFRRVVALEAIFGMAVLVCAGFLMSVAAPTDALESSAPSYQATGQGDEYTALLETTPEPASGQFSDIRVYLQTDEEEPEPLVNNTCIAEGEVRDDCVRMRWWPTGEGENASQEAVGVPEGDGWWEFKGVLWTTDGPHEVVIDLSTAYIYAESIPIHVDVLKAAEPEQNASA